MTVRRKKTKHPVLACAIKGNPRRFFGKFKDPADGVWRKIPGGPFSPEVDTREKALACADRWYEATYVAKDASVVPRRLLSWADACDAFIEDVDKRIRGADATRDEARMKARFLRTADFLSRHPLLQHDEALALRWLRQFSMEPITKSGGTKGPRDGLTVRNYVKVLRELYRFAHRRGAMSPTCPAPADGEEFRQELRALLSTKRRREFMLEPTSIAAVLEGPEVTEFRKVWVATMAYTGLRPGEIHGLKVGDLRVESRIRYLAVDRQFRLARTKTPRKFGGLKTKNSYRIMPVHPDLGRRLQSWIEEGWAKHVGRSPTPGDILLPTEEGAAFREDRANDFREMLSSVGVPSTFRGLALTPYAIRHTFSSLAKRVGIPEEDRDYFMGHTPKTSRARNYDVNDVRHLYVQVRKLPTFTTAGLAEYRARLDLLDGIDEAELAPP